MADFDVKKLRSKLGLSQQQFAILVGTSIKTISNWENGGAIPASKIPQLKTLASEADSLQQSAMDVEGGNAQALGDGSSATVNPNAADLIALISRYQNQIEQLQAEASAERERILSDARSERERLYAIIEKMQSLQSNERSS